MDKTFPYTLELKLKHTNDGIARTNQKLKVLLRKMMADFVTQANKEGIVIDEYQIISATDGQIIHQQVDYGTARVLSPFGE